MRQPWHEAERLEALRSYDVLDGDVDFADIVAIAAQVCAAPIAVVNFIDERRQWFGAEIGLGVRETPLDVSICARAILQDDLFVVPDLSLDRRFDGNPLVSGEPRLRFYGGALLKTAAGLPLGTVCILDYQPRPSGLTAQQTLTLEALARQVMRQIELRRQARQNALLLREAHHRVTNSLQRVQSLLSIQAHRAQGGDAPEMLRDATRRVQAFADMHRHLYATDGGAMLDLAAYLRPLIEGEDAAVPEGRSVALAGGPVPWPALDAPNLGLATIELVTNAIKYGQGRVSVTVSHTGTGVEIVVADEGRHLPDLLEPSHGTGMGLAMVHGLLEPHDGTLRADRSRGHTRMVATAQLPPGRDGRIKS